MRTHMVGTARYLVCSYAYVITFDDECMNILSYVLWMQTADQSGAIIFSDFYCFNI